MGALVARKITHPCQPSPIPLSGRPAHRPFRGLLGVHSRCGLHTRAVTNFVTAIRGLQTFRRLHACPGCFRLERSPGGACTRWKTPPYHGAHGKQSFGSTPCRLSPANAAACLAFGRTGRGKRTQWFNLARQLVGMAIAQRDYFDRAKQGNGTGFYATRLVSAQGRHDGLYWPVGEGESESPLGPLIDAARDAGYPGELVGGKPIPYEGYYFRILKGQGPNGDGGAKSYLHSGHMTRGFALIAWPAVFEFDRHHDVYRRPRRRCVPERPRTRDSACRQRNDDIRSGPLVVTSKRDQRITRTRPDPADAAEFTCANV